MKHKLSLLIVLFVGLSAAFSQQKELTLENALLDRYGKLAPDYLKQLRWIPEKEAYSYVKDNQVVEVEVSGGENVLFNLDALNLLMNDSLKNLPRFQWVDEASLVFNNKGNRIVVDREALKILEKTPHPKNAKNVKFCKANNSFAFTRENNLYVLDAGGEKNITEDDDKEHVYGQSVSRNEFGISGGIFWSPKGNYLAFYKKDESNVSSYPLIDYMQRVAAHTPIKYPMAGMPSEQVAVGIYNMKSGQTIYIQKQGGKEDYLTNITWSPDEKNIYVQELNRAQSHMMLNAFDAKTGAFQKTLFEEKDAAYVEPQHSLYFSKVNPKNFYYWSNKDGWYHVYQYNTDGKLVKQLTKGDWEVTSIVGFSPNEKYLYVEATKESPLQRHFYKVNTRTGALQKLTEGAGTHHVLLNSNAKYFIDSYQSTDIPNIVNLQTTEGKRVRNLLTSRDNASDYAFGENRLVEIASGNGEALYGRLILPPNFDAAKKYPVIIYVYGGPHAQMVRQTWKNSARWWQYYMAQKGYIAFTLDNRGTPNRGKAFETAIHRKLGINEVADQMQGVKYLQSLPYVDQERIGVHGWSFGGFMTLNLMLRHPKIFKVGVAGGPVVDWKLYETMYGERYMDTPQENPEGYKNSNMLELVPNLEGRLMLIHGVQDPTVVMQHSMKFLRECVKKGKQVDFFAYPTHPHNVRGKDRVHLMEKVSRYFEENL